MKQILLLTVICAFACSTYGQAKDTTGWDQLLNQPSFTPISSIKKIDKSILAKFPSWKKMSKPGGRFNATDLGGGRKKRLFFIARNDNHWVISYEHGGHGYHTHCYLINVVSKNNLDIRESNMKFDSFDSLKAFAAAGQTQFTPWRGYEY